MMATIAPGDGRRSRWSAWLAFGTGVAASVLANVLAAEPSLPARCISALPAVALVLVVEVITRSTPDHPPADLGRPARRGATVAPTRTAANRQTPPRRPPVRIMVRLVGRMWHGANR